MRLFDSICETLTRALGLSALSPWEPDVPQSPLQTTTPLIKGRPAPPPLKHVAPGGIIAGGLPEEVLYWGMDAPGKEIHVNSGPANQPDGPIFKPPSSSEGFVCDYSNMKGWKHVGNADTRGAWLEKPISPDDDTGGIYDVLTDNDHYWPTGVTRKYDIDVEDFHINADGVLRSGGKTYNREYPGPRLEACWGDWMEITVHNKMKYNGTTVHFHGARQYLAFEADGVNGVTQCPIAPGDHFTYKFRVTQFGTSWYHSHYSLQYADGLAGPMVFYGPSAGNYDHAIAPYLFGDWSHNSAFEDFWWELHHPSPSMQTTILNGRGYFDCSLANTPNCDDSTRPPLYEQIFDRGRKYLLRLINTSTASTFVFSIDKHILRVVSMDFVAIEPYYANSISVGIGQRYNVIVEALPANDLIPEEDQNYWIRIIGAEECSKIIQDNPLVGIIRYNAGSKKTPTSLPYEFNTVCRDEPYASLVPLVHRDVDAGPHPANEKLGDYYNVGVDYPQPGEVTEKYGYFQRWEITDLPIWLNFSNPTINHIGDSSFNPEEYALLTEDYGENDWVYIILSAVGGAPSDPDNPSRQYIPTAHPVHLHGHDFTLLAQELRPFHRDDLTNGTFTYKNPPRRDVVLLPSGGYVAIGFQADNPGIWVYHCHIAWHVSNGFSVQIREREKDIKLSPEFVADKDRVCKNWETWFGDSSNWWDPHEFQEDSGI